MTIAALLAGTINFHVEIGNRIAMIYPLTYGRARLGVGPASSEVFDDVW